VQTLLPLFLAPRTLYLVAVDGDLALDAARVSVDRTLQLLRRYCREYAVLVVFAMRGCSAASDTQRLAAAALSEHCTGYFPEVKVIAAVNVESGDGASALVGAMVL
jgi:hypothetical protein